MARNYRHAEFFSSGAQPLSLWLWLFAALAISGFGGLIYYLDQYEKSKSGVQNTDADTSVISESHNTNEKPTDDTSTRFDFYKLLPNISVDVPKSEIEERSSIVKRDILKQSQEKVQQLFQQQLQKKSQQKLRPVFNYILQVGSFKDYHEADRLKARLAFIGIEVKINKVTLNSSGVWHRVRIGPIQSEREMNKIRRQLRGQQIEPIMLKVKA